MKNDEEKGKKYEKQKEKHRQTLSVSNQPSKELSHTFGLSPHSFTLEINLYTALKPQLSWTIARALFFCIRRHRASSWVNEGQWPSERKY